MNSVVYKANTRGTADYGWLRANYSFSFANYFNPDRIQFGVLRVLNDDFIAPGMGFGTHPHDNMEIVTIPLKGALKHRDSMSHEGVIRPGEVQVMSAGSGLRHSEMNASHSEETNILQLWILPEAKDVTPRYDQKMFDKKAKENTFLTVVTPKDKNDGNALWIHQQAYFSLGDFSKGSTASYHLKNKAHGVYLFVIEGQTEVAGKTLTQRDAISLRDTTSVPINSIKNSKLLLIEIPMN
ncbi:MAG: pirin family protein [Bacteroidota bacterium]